MNHSAHRAQLDLNESANECGVMNHSEDRAQLDLNESYRSMGLQKMLEQNVSAAR